MICKKCLDIVYIRYNKVLITEMGAVAIGQKICKNGHTEIHETLLTQKSLDVNKLLPLLIQVIENEQV